MTIKSSFHQYWTLLLKYLKPQGGKVLLMAGFLLGTIGLQLVIPQILGRFIDTAVSGGPQESLTQMALLFIGVALMGQFCHALAAYWGGDDSVVDKGYLTLNPPQIRPPFSEHLYAGFIPDHGRHWPAGWRGLYQPPGHQKRGGCAV